VWLSTAVGVLGLLAFVVLVELVVSVTKPVLTGGVLVVVGAVLALVPAILWLVVFYVQDRLEPEPKGQVLRIFALGVLLALAIGLPLRHSLFPMPGGLSPTREKAVELLRAILVIGFAQEYLKYAAVRFTVYHSPEFDERVDGIVYGAASALGFATALNLDYVIASKGALLGVAVIRITITALAQASFTGVMGYFLGRAKFENMGRWWLPCGMVLVSILNGVVTFLLGEASTVGLGYTPFYGLIAAAVLAVVTFAFLFVAIRRVNAATLAGA
jgi:RsiW-degrading membrane proteinase PrsW (M82 family)